MHIMVLPGGRKRWRLAYRFNHKQKTLDGGEYPDVSLHRARLWCEEMRALLKAGVDPAEKRKEDAFQAKADKITFEDLALEWLEARRPSWTPRYARITETRIRSDLFPYLGQLPVRSILPRTVLEALRSIEGRGSVNMAHRIKNHCSEIFRFGIPDGRVDSDPCRDLTSAMVKAPPTRHRGKVEIKDLPEFFARLNADGGSRLSHLALRWTILTMVRTQETRFAQWDEFEGLGTDDPVWRIPAERMKMRSEHLIPLAARNRLVRIAVELSNQIRGLMRTFGLIVPSAKGGKFDEHVCRLLDGRGDLAPIMMPILTAWRSVRVRAAELGRQVLADARQSQACQLLMSIPGVGAITATAFTSAIEDPANFKKSRSVGAWIGLTTRRYQARSIMMAIYRGVVTLICAAFSTKRQQSS